MNDDLYFLPLIARALEQPDPSAALRDAFERIRVMGREPRYRRGHEQFLQFVDVARKAAGGGAEETSVSFAEAEVRPATVDVLVERDGHLVGPCSFGLAPATRAIRGIVAGDYLLRFETGRVLWEGRLAEEDLLWGRAFPGQPLRVAADTGEPARHMTREIPLLDGTLILRVLVGIEAGTLEIELKPMEATR
jgi:hypothetical protein